MDKTPKYNLKQVIHNMYVSSKNRAKKKVMLHTITESDLDKRYELCGGRCEVCFSEFDGKNKPTLDKIIPHKGYTKNNIGLLCKTCNTSKGDKTITRCIEIHKKMTCKYCSKHIIHQPCMYCGMVDLYYYRLERIIEYVMRVVTGTLSKIYHYRWGLEFNFKGGKIMGGIENRSTILVTNQKKLKYVINNRLDNKINSIIFVELMY